MDVCDCIRYKNTLKHFIHSAWSESGWCVQGGQVQILEIIANDFIHDTDYSEIKAIARNAQASSVGLTYNM